MGFMNLPPIKSITGGHSIETAFWPVTLMKTMQEMVSSL